jgi:hypothetical protein
MTAHRFVEDNTLVSPALPAVRVQVAPEFRYLSHIEFNLWDVAAGERYIFIEAADQHITRLFLAQFEGFLPNNTQTYNYRFADPLILGGQRFQPGTYAFSNAAIARESPGSEAPLTAAFLREQGYTFDDEWMMARFVTVPDATRRRELILFYLEMVAGTGHTLAEFYAGEGADAVETPVWRQIAAGLAARARQNFTVQPYAG